MSIAPEWPEPADLLAHYGDMIEALVQLERAGRAGQLAPPSQFAGMTLTEFDDRLRDMRTELDREVSLALLASCEALLRVDFWDRVARRRKEPRDVRARFKALADRDGERVRLDDILDVWRDAVGGPSRFDAFREYLRVRHWLAHGRYWTLKSARKAAPQDVLVAARALFNVLPDFPRL